jgi:hypothetical protein
LARAILSVVTLLSAVCYASFLANVDAPWAEKGYGIFGVVAIALSFVALGVEMLRKDAKVGALPSAWDAHAAIHTASDREVAVEAEVDGAGTARGAEVTLARGDEPVAVWLARLDAVPANEGAYRGDALKRDVLWEALRDEASPPDVRMAAARVLRVRYEEDGRAIRGAVADRDVRLRVDAAIEEDEAAHRIEELGPLFRAR